MDIKTNLCEAFCGALDVREVPDGFAVGTQHQAPDGDYIGFYIVGPNDSGKYRIQDDGMYMSAIESAGGDTNNKARLAAFTGLCESYGVQREEDSGELITPYVAPSEIGTSALRFLTFLLRIQDLIWMSSERAASTFKEDAIKLLREIVGERAKIIPDYVISKALQEIPADLGIVADGRPPVALFFGLSDARLMEALLLQAYAQQAHDQCSVIALLESESSVSAKMRQRANNHLSAVPNYRGEERAACARIAREALGYDPTMH
jgi:Domain of unknown function DUF1828